MKLFISEHAYKHGLDEESIRYAWSNFVCVQYRGAPNEGEMFVIGCDKKGRLLQMVGIERNFGVLIYHAMTPPTRKALLELGLL